MKCTFCGREIDAGEGKIYVTKEGDVSYFCSSKCDKNTLKLRRKPQRIKWTGRYLEEKDVRNVDEKKSAPKEKAEKKKKTSRAERRKTRVDKRATLKTKKEEIKKMKASSQKKEKPPEKKKEDAE